MMRPRARDRDRRQGRGPARLEPKPTILVVCEGEKTEPEYLSGFVNHVKNPRVEIHRAAGVPKSVVAKAKRLRDERMALSQREKDPNIAYDAVWCVFDVDEHPNLNDAKETARQCGIFTAVSNPCIELWLILHFRESPGMLHRNEAEAMVRSFVNDYEKQVDFSRFAAGYPDAVRRARGLDVVAERCGTPGHNPTTGMYRLVESLAGPMGETTVATTQDP